MVGWKGDTATDLVDCGVIMANGKGDEDDGSTNKTAVLSNKQIHDLLMSE